MGDKELSELNVKIEKLTTKLDILFPEGFTQCQGNLVRLHNLEAWQQRFIGGGIVFGISLLGILIKEMAYG